MDDDTGGVAADPTLPQPTERRQRFTVELRPGQTTIVSWKKLLRDAAARAHGGTSSSAAGGGGAVQPPTPHVNPVFESRLASGQPADSELKDGHPSRFGAVIEKIERLYMGKHSSDEEDLNDVPDDDEYDTEDSFIDDTELDDYFQVDNSAIKHTGFFVNRGKLERIEPTSLPNQQPKKRRRKDLVNDHGDGGNGQLPNKLMKVGNKAAGKSKKLVGRNNGLPHVVALPSVHNEEMRFQNQTDTSFIFAEKKSTETKTSLDPSISSRVSNSDAALLMVGNVNGQIPETLLSKTQDHKLKDGVETANASVLKYHDKGTSEQIKSEPENLSNGNGELDQSVQSRGKDGNPERPDLYVTTGEVPMENAKTLVLQRKEGSIKPKGTNLENTILELEKMVAESRPPSMEVQDADMTSQAVKRRLPHELKHKLAKVARVAQASYGGIPKEVINRLMSILGHLVQERTLKRNLKDMVAMGLTAKKEKDDKVQQMKKDVAELIRMRVPYIKSKVLEQQAGGSDDFQEMGNEEKEIIKRKYGMDKVIEDKICDLYDLFVDGLDEEADSQARKLYAELAHLWPEGFMDNRGIKRAVWRAKDRKRAYGRIKDQEKIKQKTLVPNPEVTVRVETSTVSQPQYTQEKAASEVNNYGLTLNKSVSITTSTNSNLGVASSTPSVSSPDGPKQDKVKAKESSVYANEKVPAEVLTKKKLKRKPEAELVGGHIRSEKPVSAPRDEKIKSHNKLDMVPMQKSSLSSVVAASTTTKAVSPPVNMNNPADMR